MIIQLTNKEFQELRKFLINLKNPKATKAFNEVFSGSPTGGVKGFVNPVNKDIIINIPESLAFDIEKIFVKNGDEIGKMIKNGSSISNAPKWISCIKNIFSEITNVVTRR